MIQQSPSIRAAALGPWLLLSALLSLGACGRPPGPEAVTRSVDGLPRRGAFIPPFAYEAYVRGELALSKGRPEAAVAQFELALAAPEEDAYLLSRLGYALAVAGRTDEAAQTFAHAERLDPCAEAAWLARGTLAEDSGRLDQASLAYARASECAPASAQAWLGQARVLERAGRLNEALDVLSRYARGDHPQAARAAFELALRADDPAELAHALETWLALRAPSAEALERAVAWALARDRPLLALRLSEHHRGPLPAPLDARLKRALGDREGLLGLLARTNAEDLGGPRAAAELALYAGASERAELETTSALRLAPSAELFALRAQARMAMGRNLDALEDLAAIEDPSLRRETVLALLALSGSPALAAELSARDAAAQQPRAPQ